MIRICLLLLLCVVAMQARASNVLDVKDYGAIGDGVSDDGPAINLAIAQANTLFLHGTHSCVYFPPGTYRVATLLTPFAVHNPGCVFSDALHRVYILVDSSYSGDLFSWDDTVLNWSNQMAPSKDTAGAYIANLIIMGDTGAPSQQNAFVFYDRNDDIHMQNVDVLFLNGRALALGFTKIIPNAYVRESFFNNLTFWNCGTATSPCMEVTSAGTGDSTNELNFYGVNMLHPASDGIVLRNKNSKKPLGQIRFYGPRVEAAGYGDLFRIGDTSPVYAGRVSDVTMYGGVFNGSARNFAAIGLYANAASEQPYGITVHATIPTGAGTGLNIQAGRNSEFFIADMGTSGTGLVVGPSPLVGMGIYVDGYGSEQSWTNSIDPTSATFVRRPQNQAF